MHFRSPEGHTFQGGLQFVMTKLPGPTRNHEHGEASISSCCWSHGDCQNLSTNSESGGADGRENRHIQFVQEFVSVVSTLQDKTNNATHLRRHIFRAVEDLATCPYTSDAFSKFLGKIQAVVGSSPSLWFMH